MISLPSVPRSPAADHASSRWTLEPYSSVTDAPGCHVRTATAALNPAPQRSITEYITPSGAHDGSTRATGRGGGGATPATRPHVTTGASCTLAPPPMTMAPYASSGSAPRRTPTAPLCGRGSTWAFDACVSPMLL